MPFARKGGPRADAALRDVELTPFWLDRPDRPGAAAGLDTDTDTDLLIVGAGFTGLWAALLAKQERPERDVLLVEGGRVAAGASGRNGGFVASSLTHGFHNGLSRWPGELRTLVRLGHANLDAIEATVREHAIDCDFRRTGELDVATEEHQVAGLRALPAAAAPYGEDLRWLDRDEVRARVASPTYLGGVLDARGVAVADPARLAWGLRRACLESGVRLHERTPVRRLSAAGPGRAGVRAECPQATVTARQVLLATNAFPPLLHRIQPYVVPVYDYVLVTEPLTPAQRASIGWQGREGVGDSGNLFHYYRTTEDGRILWGGYDAVYHWGNGFGPRWDNDHDSYARLAEHFLATFPQLEGVRFTHAWGGAIDTCSRFSAFWGTALGGRVAYVLGYTGLGVGASRFGALVALDLLARRATERTALEMARTKPVPFPPEPMRSVGIGLTRWSVDRADRAAGRRNLWLRALDRLGLGFDS